MSVIRAWAGGLEAGASRPRGRLLVSDPPDLEVWVVVGLEGEAVLGQEFARSHFTSLSSDLSSLRLRPLASRLRPPSWSPRALVPCGDLQSEEREVGLDIPDMRRRGGVVLAIG